LHLTNSSQLNLELRIIIAAMVEGRRHASLSKRRVLNDEDATLPPTSCAPGVAPQWRIEPHGILDVAQKVA